MLTFMEYYTQKLKEKKLQEDAVLAAGSGSCDNSVVSPQSNSTPAEPRSPNHSAVPPMSDCSVLGKLDTKNRGFMSRNDFFIPANALSGNYYLKRHV